MVVAKIDVWSLLALALSKLNQTTIESLINEYEASQAASEADMKILKARGKAEMEKLKGSTESVCNGKVTSAISVVSLAAGSSAYQCTKCRKESRAVGKLCVNCFENDYLEMTG